MRKKRLPQAKKVVNTRSIHSRFLSVEPHIFKFDRNFYKWVKKGRKRRKREEDFKRTKTGRSHLFCERSIVNSFNFELLSKISGRRDLFKLRRWLILESWKLSCFGRKTSTWYSFWASKTSIMTDLSVWQKSPESIETREISADSPFSFWVIEPKEKRVLGGIFKKVSSGEEKVIRATFFVMKSIVKSFNFEKLAKIRKKKTFAQFKILQNLWETTVKNFFTKIGGL